ncbi:MAG: MOSC N-terminal beta barrel domain-containing protein [Acidimicrobiales bacterium]
MQIGRVGQLWSYPVKSFAGVSVDVMSFEDEGPAGDRAWGVYDVEADVVMSAKRVGALLFASVDGDVATLPTGASGRLGDATLDESLSEWLGRSVRMVHVDEEPTLRQEMHRDNEDDTSLVIRWRTPRGRYVDLFPLHLMATVSLDQMARAHPDVDWDVRRFRPNALFETDVPEEEWLGRTLCIGAVELSVPDQLTERCVMTTRAQPWFGEQRSILRTIARHRRGFEGPLTAGSAGAQLGCYGEVVVAGTIRVGDAVELT